MNEKLKMWKNRLLDLLFPQFCLQCRKEGFLVCLDCLSTIDINPYQYCPFCSSPNRVIEKGKCSSHADFKLNGLFSAVSYQNHLVKKMLSLFKYKPYVQILAKPLAFLIVSHFALLEKQEVFNPSLRSGQATSAIFIPVPIAAKKMRERGYNQSALLAKHLANYYQLPLITKALKKIKNTQNQVGLKKEQRQQNVFNAFSIALPEKISGKTIFLIDDVYTTGSTMEECSRVLKLAGAKQVWGIVVAREGLENSD